MADSSNCDSPCDGESVGKTTELKCDLQPLNIDSISFSDSDVSSVSSVVSMKEGCESPMSSWASHPENDISSITSPLVRPEESLQKFLQNIGLPEGNFEKHLIAEKNNDDGFLWQMDNRSYEELLKKFNKKKEELRVSNLKLRLSEQEIVGLKVQVENSESQINDMHEKLELKEYELNEQKELLNKEIFKLMAHIKKSESQLDNVHEGLKVNKGQLLMMHEKLDNVRKEMELKAGQFDNVCEELKQKEEELNEQKEIYSKSSMAHELQCQIKDEKEIIAALKSKLESLVKTNEDNDINHKEEMRKLISTMFDLHVKSFWRKEELRSDIASLSKQKEQLTYKLEYYESRQEIRTRIGS